MKDKKHDIQEELKALSPFLFQQKTKEPGGELPENYFKSMQSDVLNRLNIDKEEVPIKEKVKNNWRESFEQFFQLFFQPKYALAFASVALVLSATLWYFNDTQTSVNYLAEESVFEYLESNLEDLDDELLVELQSNDDSDVFLDELEAESIEDFLNEGLEDLDDESFENLF